MLSGSTNTALAVNAGVSMPSASKAGSGGVIQSSGPHGRVEVATNGGTSGSATLNSSMPYFVPQYSLDDSRLFSPPQTGMADPSSFYVDTSRPQTTESMERLLASAHANSRPYLLPNGQLAMRPAFDNSVQAQQAQQVQAQAAKALNFSNVNVGHAGPAANWQAMSAAGQGRPLGVGVNVGVGQPLLNSQLGRQPDYSSADPTSSAQPWAQITTQSRFAFPGLGPSGNSLYSQTIPSASAQTATALLASHSSGGPVGVGNVNVNVNVHGGVSYPSMGHAATAILGHPVAAPSTSSNAAPAAAAVTSAADSTAGGSEIPFKSVVECGFDPNVLTQAGHTVVNTGNEASPDVRDVRQPKRAYTIFSAYFNMAVNVYQAVADPYRRILYRSSDLSRKLKCPANMLAMYLSRRKQNRNSGIFQATGFRLKNRDDHGLMCGGYFVSLEACQDFEAYLRNPWRVRNEGSRKKARKTDKSDGDGGSGDEDGEDSEAGADIATAAPVKDETSPPPAAAAAIDSAVVANKTAVAKDASDDDEAKSVKSIKRKADVIEDGSASEPRKQARLDEPVSSNDPTPLAPGPP